MRNEPPCMYFSVHAGGFLHIKSCVMLRLVTHEEGYYPV